MKGHFKEGIIIVCLVFLVGLFILINHSINQQIDYILDGATDTSRTLVAPPPLLVDNLEKRGNNVLRIEHKAPDRDYSESVLYRDKREIARFKRQGEKIYDMVGDIPNGEIQFVNEWENTYGYEHYEDGERNGPYLEFYSNGNKRVEAQYKKGRLMERKKYYANGALRMEEDYRDTHFARFRNRDEIGIGKIYRPEGQLKYEWFFVDGAPEGFNKTYDREGNLIEANYFDANGVLIRHWPESE